MGCLRGMSMIRYTRNSIYARCLGQFFFKFSWEETSMCRVWMLKMIAFFPRNIHWSSLLDRKACVNTERVPPGHPIILLKSTKLKYGPHIGKKVYYIVLHFIVKLNLQLTVIGFISVDDFLYADHTILLVCTCVHVVYIYYS